MVSWKWAANMLSANLALVVAWDILIPNMKFYQRASAILEEIEDGLLQLTVAKAKGKPEEGMAIFTKLGMGKRRKTLPKNEKYTETWQPVVPSFTLRSLKCPS